MGAPLTGLWERRWAALYLSPLAQVGKASNQGSPQSMLPEGEHIPGCGGRGCPQGPLGEASDQNALRVGQSHKSSWWTRVSTVCINGQGEEPERQWGAGR